MHKNHFVTFLRYACFLIALTREDELERAQAARALPFPFGRKRKQTGPFCTARRQQKDRDTLKAVRRTFPNSTPHGVSNTWKGSFLPLPCAAGAKIPSRATQKSRCGRCLGLPTELNGRLRNRSETMLFCALFSFLRLDRQAEKRPFPFGKGLKGLFSLSFTKNQRTALFAGKASFAPVFASAPKLKRGAISLSS